MSDIGKRQSRRLKAIQKKTDTLKNRIKKIDDTGISTNDINPHIDEAEEAFDGIEKIVEKIEEKIGYKHKEEEDEDEDEDDTDDTI